MQPRGEIRNQYHHAIDLVPTILDVTGVKPPSVVNGVTQSPIQGASMRYSFDDAQATSTRTIAGGTIKRVAVDVSGEPYVDLEREAVAMMARE